MNSGNKKLVTLFLLILLMHYVGRKEISLTGNQSMMAESLNLI